MAAYDFTNISPFTDLDGNIFGAILKGMQSASLWTVHPGIIVNTNIPIVSDTMYLIENGTLPLSMDTGATKYDAMALNPMDLGTVRGYGASDFNQYYGKFQTSPQIEQGIPFEEFTYSYLTTNFLTGYEDKMFNHPLNGLVKKLYNQSALTTNVAYTAMTSNNAEAVVNSYWTRKPVILQGIQTDLVVSMGDFENYVLSLSLGNKFDSAAFASNVNGNEYKVPGTAGLLTIKGYSALNNKSVALLTNKGNFHWGYGSDMDWNAQQFVYSVGDDKLIFRLKTKMCVNVAIPAQVLRAV